MSTRPFHRISGALYFLGSAPDGDSVRFHAMHTRDLARLADGGPLALSKDGGVQLRLEGIDAPELHFRGVAQPYGRTARDELLAAIGVMHVTWKHDRMTARAAVPPAIRATILARECDPHGRPIAYLFTSAAAADLDALPSHTRALHGDDSDARLLRRSQNAELLRTGAAYPLLYDTQPAAHRALFAHLARLARDEQRGLWPHDRTAHGLPLTPTARTTDAPLVWPKLFRRVVEFLAARDDGFRGSMRDWLADPSAGAQNDRLRTADGGAVHFADAVSDGVTRAGLSLDPCEVVCVARRAASYANLRARRREATMTA